MCYAWNGSHWACSGSLFNPTISLTSSHNFVFFPSSLSPHPITYNPSCSLLSKPTSSPSAGDGFRSQSLPKEGTRLSVVSHCTPLCFTHQLMCADALPVCILFNLCHSASVDFEIPMYVCSGLQIRFMKVLDHSQMHAPKRWVRYITHR